MDKKIILSIVIVVLIEIVAVTYQINLNGNLLNPLSSIETEESPVIDALAVPASSGDSSDSASNGQDNQQSAQQTDQQTGQDTQTQSNSGRGRQSSSDNTTSKKPSNTPSDTLSNPTNTITTQQAYTLAVKKVNANFNAPVTIDQSSVTTTTSNGKTYYVFEATTSDNRLIHICVGTTLDSSGNVDITIYKDNATINETPDPKNYQSDINESGSDPVDAEYNITGQ